MTQWIPVHIPLWLPNCFESQTPKERKVVSTFTIGSLAHKITEKRNFMETQKILSSYNDQNYVFDISQFLTGHFFVRLCTHISKI